MDLQTAAHRMSVHYQTAYRWVRAGSLPAVKVGAAYQIDEEALARFAAARLAPTPPPSVTRVRNWADQVDRLHGSLLAGDEPAARTLVDRLHQGGIGPAELCQRLLAPAMASIGVGWADGRVSIAAEHRAAALCEAMLVRVSEHPSGRPRGVAVVATPEGERHGLPAAMAAVALRSDRWQVHHLGTEVPLPDLIGLAGQVAAGLVVLSITYLPARLEAVATARALAATGCRCLIGRPGLPVSVLLDEARRSPC
jgi:excisionase family DNA binding protein